jgi:hypothetical protein
VHSQQLRCSTTSIPRPRVASQARPAATVSISPHRPRRDVSADTPPRVPGQKNSRSRSTGQSTPSSTHAQKKKDRDALVFHLQCGTANRQPSISEMKNNGIKAAHKHTHNHQHIRLTIW